MLRVSELYPSFQGEGPNTGDPTVFVRFAGCNLRCPGWPCDTPYAIEPKIFTKEQKKMAPMDIVEHITRLYPSITNVCLTGGEPFLQKHEDLHTLALNLRERKINVEVFTNGTIEWGPIIPTSIDNFIMDWKLPGSGEFPDEDMVLNNLNCMRGPFDAVKFTVKDEADLERAHLIYDMYVRSKEQAPVVYCGIVWEGGLTEKQVAEWILTKGLAWRLNVQVHKYVWDPKERGI